MKSYEILPAGMTGSAMGGGAKVPKSYEILPGAGTAAQGLGRKGGECGCADSEGVSLPSGPITPGGAVGSRAAAYEILPSIDPSMQTRGDMGGACDCKKSPNTLPSTLSQQPYDWHVQLDTSLPVNTNVNQILNHFFEEYSPDIKSHEKLLRVESIVTDLPAGRSVRNAVAVAWADSMPDRLARGARENSPGAPAGG